MKVLAGPQSAASESPAAALRPMTAQPLSIVGRQWCCHCGKAVADANGLSLILGGCFAVFCSSGCAAAFEDALRSPQLCATRPTVTLLRKALNCFESLF